MKSEGEKPSVFISYRRGGGSEIARIIEAFLDAQELDVFLDVDSLGGGHFDEQILAQIEASGVFILICSPGCFDRCDDPGDWVRRELEHAISLEKRLVPVVIWGFTWPRPEELPESIRAVSRYNAFEYSHTHWKQTREKLLGLIGVDARRTAGASHEDEWGPGSNDDRAPDEASTVDVSEVGELLVRLVATLEGTDRLHLSDLARLIRFAEQGNAAAQTILGVTYLLGRGVEQSDERAVAWFRKAAEQGHADAQRFLGSMFEAGRGVEQSDEQAVSWYRKAAEQGIAVAQNNLGVMYQDGRGVEQSDAEAVSWYRKAAEQGNEFAQCSLGRMYESGKGVEQSDQRAVWWYRKAAKQGFAEAAAALERRNPPSQSSSVSIPRRHPDEASESRRTPVAAEARPVATSGRDRRTEPTSSEQVIGCVVLAVGVVIAIWILSLLWKLGAWFLSLF